MKVLITVNTYWPEINGIQNVTQYEAEELAKRGHVVTVITSDYHKYIKREIHNGVRIIRLPIYEKNTLHHGNKKEFQKLVIELGNQCDAMFNVCLQSFAADWIVPILSKIKCRKVLMMHGMHKFKWDVTDTTSLSNIEKKVLRNIRWGIFYKRNWKKILSYDAAVFAFEQDYAIDYFEKHGFKKNYIVHNAVDDCFFDVTQDQKRDIVLNVGSFNSRKNQLKTMELFYKANTNEYSLYLIGLPENDYYNMLRKKKEIFDTKYGEKNVYIICNQDVEDTNNLFKQCKIYMINSTWENLPISLIDAMAGGAAFISSDIGVIKYTSGGIIARNDKEMINGLEQLIKGGWEEYGKEALEYANANFRRETQINNLERILFSNNS